MGLEGFPENLPAMQEMQVQFLGQEGPLGEEMVTHSSILVCKIPWIEEPGVLQSMGSQKVQFSSVQSFSHVRLFATP